MSITRDLVISVQDGSSSLNTPLSVYRNDRGIELSFEIKDFSYNFSGDNIIQSLDNATASIIIKKPNGDVLRTSKGRIESGKLKFTINQELTDELHEIGTYQLQIQFYDSSDNRITIPPIYFEVKQLIADIDDDDKTYPQVSFGLVGECLVSIKGKKGQDIEGLWIDGEYITAQKLNYTKEKALNGDMAYKEVLAARKNYGSLGERLDSLSEKIEKQHKEIVGARTATSGESFNTLDERIDTEIKRLQDKIETTVSTKEDETSYKVDNTIDGTTIDMVVKGRTLQNLIDVGGDKVFSTEVKMEEGILKLKKNGTGLPVATFNFLSKPSTEYTLIYNIVKNTITEPDDGNYLFYPSSSDINTMANTIVPFNKTGINKIKLTSKVSVKGNINFGWHKVNIGAEMWIKDFMILEGDWTDKEIPRYFEGIKSVGEEEGKIEILSTGKNLISLEKFFEKHQDAILERNEDVYKIKCVGDLYSKGYELKTPKTVSVRMKLKTTKGQSTNLGIYLRCTDGTTKQGSRITPIEDYEEVVVSATKPVKNVCLNWSVSGTFNIKDIQIEESPSPTEYEPYKSDKTEILLLTENGLKGIGKVKDEIIMKPDGVYLIQRIGREILNRSMGWNFNTGALGAERKTRQFFTKYFDTKMIGRGELKCSHYPFIKGQDVYSKDIVGVGNFGSGNSLRIGSPHTTLEGFYEYLEKNNVILYYPLTEPVEHKLLDITDINLNTYKGITHITSSNAIKPLLQFKVLLNTQEELNSLRNGNDGLKRENAILVNKADNLEKENMELKQVNEIQDNMIDTTMLATDEIFTIFDILTSSVQTMEIEVVPNNVRVDFYANMVKRGLKKLEDIPERFKEEVKEIVN